MISRSVLIGAVAIALLLPACGLRNRFTGRPLFSSASSGEPAPAGISTDSAYGYSASRPIKVGGGEDGARHERAYLSGLLGPRGEPVSYARIQSCCAFETDNGIAGYGLLDVYAVTCEGRSDTAVLFLNMYDYEAPKAPVGFTHR